jgi:Ca2+-binding EF-hand superfamily protein
MLFGKYPFDDQNKSVLFDKIKNAEPKYNTSLISNEALNLIQSLLKKDPKKRPDASSILDHPWFAKMIKDKFKDNVNDLNVISTLKTFKTPNAFLKKILTFIVKDAQGNNEIDEIKRKFYILDDNKNGVVEISKYQSHIDPISINSIVKKQEDNNYNESHELFGDCILNKFVKNDIPTNANSQVGSKMDYTSYLAANLREKKLITEESIRSLFSRFDVDKQGFINVNSFHKALRRTGKQISEDECEVMLKDAGFKNPNLIEYDEFLKIVGDFLC